MSKLSRRAFLTSTAGLLTSSACSTPTNASPRFDRDRFVDEVRRALPAGQAAVDEVLARAVADPRLVIRELGEPDARAADLLYCDDELTIFNIVWPPDAVIGPHDHLMWASIGCYSGREDNVVWRRNGDAIERVAAESVGVRGVFPLPGDAIHSVRSAEREFTAAIHVYGGDLTAASGSRWDPNTLEKVARAAQPTTARSHV